MCVAIQIMQLHTNTKSYNTAQQKIIVVGNLCTFAYVYKWWSTPRSLMINEQLAIVWTCKDDNYEGKFTFFAN